jgi:tryptophanase
MVPMVALAAAVTLTLAHRVLAVQHLHQVKETLAVMVFKQVGGHLVVAVALEQQELAD